MPRRCYGAILAMAAFYVSRLYCGWHHGFAIRKPGYAAYAIGVRERLRAGEPLAWTLRRFEHRPAGGARLRLRFRQRWR